MSEAPNPNDQQPQTGDTYNLVARAPFDITSRYIDLWGNYQFQDAIRQERLGGDWKVYREMLRDETIAASFQQLKLALIGKEWAVEPAADNGPELAAAEFITDQLKRLEWDQITQKMVDGIYWGYKVAKLTYGNEGGRWTLTAPPYTESAPDGQPRQVTPGITVEPIELFRWHSTRRMRGLTNNHPMDGEELPPRNFWWFTAGGSDDYMPHGQGLAQSLYWLWWFKRNGIKYWLAFLDKFGIPTAVGKYLPGTPPEKQKELIDALQAIHNESAIAIPNNAAIELLQATRSGSADYDKFPQRMDEGMMRLILGQTMTSQDGSSRSQAEVHLTVRDEQIQAIADLIDGSFNRGPVRWLTEWNFGPNVKPPRVFRKIKQEPDAAPKASVVKTMSEAGWEPTEDKVRQDFGEGWQKKAQPQTPAPFDTSTRPAPANFAEPGTILAQMVKNREDQEAIAQYAAQIAAQYAELFGPTLDDIATAVQGADSFEEARAALDELFGRPPTAKLVDSVRDKTAISWLAGMFKAQRQ